MNSGVSSQAISGPYTSRRNLILHSNGVQQPLRRPSSQAYPDYSQLPRSVSHHGTGERSLNSPVDGAFRPPTRSPSAFEAQPRQSSLRMGSALRMSMTPQRASLLPQRSSLVPGGAGMYRRSSTMMNLDSVRCVAYSAGFQHKLIYFLSLHNRPMPLLQIDDSHR